MKIDLHIHSIYSSHALYVNNQIVMKRFKSEYDVDELFDERNLWWLEKLLIDGISTPEQILIQAKIRGLRAVAITDHNTTIGNLEAQKLSDRYGILVIPAMELSTKEGEILAYGIKKKIPYRLSAVNAIKEIHAQDGIAVAAHPFNMRHFNTDFTRLDRKHIQRLDLDGIEVASPVFGLREKWVDFAKQRNIAITGGSDAHTSGLIGSVWTNVDDKCDTVEKILNAIIKKQTKVAVMPNRVPLFTKTFFEYLSGNLYRKKLYKFFK
jgi:predicted metal-dependent phosphoesterase TrpH